MQTRAAREWTTDIKTKIPVPIGISAANSSVGRWFKRVGDPVSIVEPLVEIESDNITIEVLAPATGVLSEVFLKDGQSVVGSGTLGSITEFGGRKDAIKTTTIAD